MLVQLICYSFLHSVVPLFYIILIYVLSYIFLHSFGPNMLGPAVVSGLSEVDRF